MRPVRPPWRQRPQGSSCCPLPEHPSAGTAPQVMCSAKVFRTSFGEGGSYRTLQRVTENRRVGYARCSIDERDVPDPDRAASSRSASPKTASTSTAASPAPPAATGTASTRPSRPSGPAASSPSPSSTGSPATSKRPAKSSATCPAAASCSAWAPRSMTGTTPSAALPSDPRHGRRVRSQPRPYAHREGMALAKKNGKLKGKQPKLPAPARRSIRRRNAEGEVSLADPATEYSVGRSTHPRVRRLTCGYVVCNEECRRRLRTDARRPDGRDGINGSVRCGRTVRRTVR